MSNDYKDILFAIKDYVCTITINRPKSLNAFTGDTIAELEDAVLRTYDDDSIGVVVLTGAGDRAFSAGGDNRDLVTKIIAAALAHGRTASGQKPTFREQRFLASSETQIVQERAFQSRFPARQMITDGRVNPRWFRAPATNFKRLSSTRAW